MKKLILLVLFIVFSLSCSYAEEHFFFFLTLTKSASAIPISLTFDVEINIDQDEYPLTLENEKLKVLNYIDRQLVLYFSERGRDFTHSELVTILSNPTSNLLITEIKELLASDQALMNVKADSFRMEFDEY